ncbi:hypothetical protein EYF80_035273 [Liparis tanakae]|uniref:Uncharacterized protein n=1 Tax=Liparis tanakae TaxID=230148 RepID=A0A4Z2GLL9_9TELE|nr:hypothetical protein EYF80_035273 [Liparis tanakae]
MTVTSATETALVSFMHKMKPCDGNAPGAGRVYQSGTEPKQSMKRGGGGGGVLACSIKAYCPE